MKIISKKADKSYEYFNYYEYKYDSLKTTEEIQTLLEDLQKKNCIIERFKIHYKYDRDYVVLPEEYTSMDDFLFSYNINRDSELLEKLFLKGKYYDKRITIIIKPRINYLEIAIEK